MVVKLDRNEALLPLYKLRLWSFTTGIILLTGVFLVAKTITRSISEPLLKLTESTKLIASGDLLSRIDIKTSDEIGQLADSFNVMLERLEKRTKEILATRQALEQELVDRLQAEEKINRLAAIVESSDDAIIGMGLDGTIASWNQGATKIYGFSRKEIIDKPISILTPPGMLEEIMQLLERVQLGFGIEHYETTKQRKDGNIISVSLSISPIKDTLGEFIGASLIARDITTRKRVEEDRKRLYIELTEVNAQLQSNQKELEEFIYTISHDLKAPLISIQGFARLLQNKMHDSLDVNCKRYFERIITNTQNMEQLLMDLLEISRIGKTNDITEKIDLKELVDDIFETFSVTATDKNISLLKSDNLPSIEGRVKRIREAIANLIDNAIKYMPEKENAAIEVGFDPEMEDKNGVKGVFYVRDNGEGILPQYQSRIFNIFQRGSRQSDIKDGSGVGLAIVKKIMELHGGMIWLKSTPGQGATFCFTLPTDKNRVDTTETARLS